MAQTQSQQSPADPNPPLEEEEGKKVEETPETLEDPALANAPKYVGPEALKDLGKEAKTSGEKLVQSSNAGLEKLKTTE